MKKLELVKSKKNVFYCALFVLVVVLYQLSIRPLAGYSGDDLYFSKPVGGLAAFFEWLHTRYNTWSSRTIIEAILAFFERRRFVLAWNIANVFIYILLAYALYVLSNKASIFATLSLTLMYPVIDMASAGWIATFMNYLWPLAFGMYSLTVPYKIARGKDPRWWEIAAGLAATIIGANAEQSCAMLLAMMLWYTFEMFLKRTDRLHVNSKLWAVIILYYIIILGSLVAILVAPGNAARKVAEVGNWMRDFYEKNIIDKVIDGFESTMALLLSSSNIIFTAFNVFTFFCCWKKTANTVYRAVSGLPISIELLVSFGKTDTNGFFSNIVNLITSNASVDASNWVKVSYYIPVVLYLFVAFSVIMSFFVMFDNLLNAMECSFIFMTAIATRVVMGLSPTLFASSLRTFVFCYFLLILIMLKIIAYNYSLFGAKDRLYLKYAATAVCAITALNNICTICNRY